MEQGQALAALAGLAHQTRLAVFRLLVACAPGGLSAGTIAGRVGVAPSTLSFHLSELERAGLLRSARRQRQIDYAIDPAGIRQLILFLTEDCCGGRPELCGGPATPRHVCIAKVKA